jgi:hypothetical protein
MRRQPVYAVVMLGVGTPKKHMLLAAIEGSLMASALKNCVQLGTEVIKRMPASTLLNSANVTNRLINIVLPTPLGHVAAHDAPTEPIIQPDTQGTM